MSYLIPGNLSGAHGTRQPPNGDGALSVCDPPISFGEVENQRILSTFAPDVQTHVTPEVANTQPTPQSSPDVPQKPRAAPVVSVDRLELMEPDEYGAELAKDARVWKVYVKEADQRDMELVDGWNKSLDVIL
ncbi:unnamed protein product, partial [Rhizoctonia solani]